MDTLTTALTRSTQDPPSHLAEELDRIGFSDVSRTWCHIRHLYGQLDALAPETDLFSAIYQAIVTSYDPQRAFNNLITLMTESDVSRIASILKTLNADAEKWAGLMAICSGSQSLAVWLIRHPDCILDLFSSDRWRALESREKLEDRINRLAPADLSFDAALTGLRRYKNQAYLHIALCDLMKTARTPDVLTRLSDVADICLERALDICSNTLEERHGRPMLDENRPSGFAVIGMGKLGGQELNFSSDIDLLYVYDSTDGRTSISRLSTYEYYPRLARMVTDLISRITADGLVFRVDLRLRPEGRAGDIANSVDGYRWHYENHGQMWERQALIKVRCSAGDANVGNLFVQTVTSHIFPSTPDPLILDEINRMREKIAHALIERGSGDGHVKLGPGGIREIEFIIQGFQMVYSGLQRWPRERSTLKALACVAERGYLADSETADLREAYLFLRDLENRIQMMAGHQTHEIPQDGHQQATLARMMGFQADTVEKTASALLSRYSTHTARVRAIYERVFHSTM